VLVRTAAPDDLDALRGVFRRSALHWDDDRAWLLAHPHHLAWSGPPPGGETRLVVADGAVLGFASVAPVEGRGWEVVDLFVDPDAMGRGVGRALIADLVDRARAAGVGVLWVTGNPSALGFYTAVGFVVAGTAPTARSEAPRLRLDVG
jgi:GNAT superfamily N-acetyltransferase